MDLAKLENPRSRSAPGWKIPGDISLLLRCHAEGCFLAYQVLPALGEVAKADGETRQGAWSTLLDRWSRAERQALATDSCFEALRARPLSGPLAHGALRYYAAVRRLRNHARRMIERLDVG